MRGAVYRCGLFAEEVNDVMLPVIVGLGALIGGLALRKYVRYKRYVGEMANSLSRYYVGKNEE